MRVMQAAESRQTAIDVASRLFWGAALTASG
jgi:hypothetical protein